MRVRRIVQGLVMVTALGMGATALRAQNYGFFAMGGGSLRATRLHLEVGSNHGLA